MWSIPLKARIIAVKLTKLALTACAVLGTSKALYPNQPAQPEQTDATTKRQPVKPINAHELESWASIAERADIDRRAKAQVLGMDVGVAAPQAYDSPTKKEIECVDASESMATGMAELQSIEIVSARSKANKAALLPIDNLSDAAGQGMQWAEDIKTKAKVHALPEVGNAGFTARAARQECNIRPVQEGITNDGQANSLMRTQEQFIHAKMITAETQVAPTFTTRAAVMGGGSGGNRHDDDNDDSDSPEMPNNKSKGKEGLRHLPSRETLGDPAPSYATPTPTTFHRNPSHTSKQEQSWSLPESSSVAPTSMRAEDLVGRRRLKHASAAPTLEHLPTERSYDRLLSNNNMDLRSSFTSLAKGMALASASAGVAMTEDVNARVRADSESLPSISSPADVAMSTDVSPRRGDGILLEGASYIEYNFSDVGVLRALTQEHYRIIGANSGLRTVTTDNEWGRLRKHCSDKSLPVRESRGELILDSSRRVESLSAFIQAQYVPGYAKRDPTRRSGQLLEIQDRLERPFLEAAGHKAELSNEQMLQMLGDYDRRQAKRRKEEERARMTLGSPSDGVRMYKGENERHIGR